MNTDQNSSSKIIVVVRKRPLSKKEQQKGETDIVEVKDVNQVIVREIKSKLDLTKFIEEHHFNFDMAFDDKTSNEGVYFAVVRPIIEAAFNKAKVTCFAYGQTGSGKTYTMLGDQENQIPGLYLLASYDIFNFLEQPQFGHLSVTISFYEIYCGKLFDLLNDRSQLQAREDAKGNVNIVGLTEKKITNVQTLMQIIEHGQSTRMTSQNSANAESSRSHALLQIALKSGKHVHGIVVDNFYSSGKLSFIDLAGSERGADVSEQNKQTRIDGAEINKSLLALKECIRALDQQKNHTPFRGSKLTLVLKDSFMGNCRTVMIGTISPNSSNSEHSLNTLRYSDRVKELRKASQEQQLQPLSNLDQLAKELMLPRQQKNVVKLPYKNPDDQSDEEDHYKFIQQPQQRGSMSMAKMDHPNLAQQQEPFQHKSKRIAEQMPVPAKQPQHPVYLQDSDNGQQQLQVLSKQHEYLVSQILSEEEEVVKAHREHIDQMVETTKQMKEMILLNQVDQPQSDITYYVKSLQKIIDAKMRQLGDLKFKLENFSTHLQQEQVLSEKFYECRSHILEAFDIQDHIQQQNDDDLELLDDLE